MITYLDFRKKRLWLMQEMSKQDSMGDSSEGAWKAVKSLGTASSKNKNGPYQPSGNSSRHIKGTACTWLNINAKKKKQYIEGESRDRL